MFQRHENIYFMLLKSFRGYIKLFLYICGEEIGGISPERRKIMKKITILYLSRLSNAHHFSFLKEFLSDFDKANFSEQKLRDAGEELKACFEDEGKYFRLSKEARQTQQIKAADHGRDIYYRKLKRLAKVWLDTPFDKAAAAEKVMKKLLNYRLNTNENYLAESALVYKLVNNLSEPDMLQAVELIGGKDLLDMMKQYNEEVKTLMNQRSNESVKVPKKALQQARAQNDAIYTRLISLLEAYSATADDPKVFDTFIDQWNGNIEAYRTAIKRRATFRAKAREAKEAEERND